MDLVGEATRLRLDLLAVEISRQFAASGIPHALLKGPSTANWLYAPPRGYIDVDLLVPGSRICDAVRSLVEAGIARASAGDVGEEAQHSLLMISTAGFEVDLHVSLPTLAPAGDRVWDELSAHLEVLDLGVGSVPALDRPARCLVLALHALGSGALGSQSYEDLRRAREMATQTEWRSAAELSRRLDAEDLFEAGLQRVDPARKGIMSSRARLYAIDAPSTALGLQRLADASWRDRPRLLWRELFPTRGFMLRAFPQYLGAAFGLPRAHLRRWWSLARQLPEGVKSWRAVRR